MAFFGKHVILAICSVLGDLPLLSTWLTYLLLLWAIKWQEHVHKAPSMSSGLNQKLLGTQLCVDEIQKNLNPAKQSSSFVCVEDSNEAHPCSLGEQATFLCNIGVGQTSCLMWQGNRDSENCYTLISSWKQCTCFWCDLKRNLYPLFFLEAMCTGSKLEEAENSWCC